MVLNRTAVEHDPSNKSVPPDGLGRAYEYLIKQFADDAGAKAGEFFTPPEVVDALVRMLEPQSGDIIYDPTCGSGGMLVHSADYLREQKLHPTAARYFGQEMNWGNAAIGKINSVMHGLEAEIKAGSEPVSTLTTEVEVAKPILKIRQRRNGLPQNPITYLKRK